MLSQQRINYFFPPISRKKAQPKSRCHFLELPPKIRRQIYHEAGLPSGRAIHMNFWSSPQRDNINGRPNDPYCEMDVPSIPTNIFPVCRAVYEDVTTILYSENGLAITRRARKGLRMLERMTPATAQKLKFVVLRLNLSSCDNMCCRNTCNHPETHDMPLNDAVRAHQLIISQYQRIFTKLATSIQAGNLKLYLICDCANLGTAKLIVDALVQLPLLLDCGLRLAKSRSTELVILAKETVLRVTKQSLASPSLLPFNFPRLPKEIQLQILAFTELAERHLSFCRNALIYPPACDRVCSTIAKGPSFGNRYLYKCFCSSGHSAFNPRCKCDNRTALCSFFLVSRAFRELATEVFFGQNQFVISMGKETRTPEEWYTLPSFEWFPRGSMAFLTHLIIDFDGFEVGYMDQHLAEWDSWEESIIALSKQVNPATLHIEVRFSEKSYVSVWDIVLDDAVYLLPGYKDQMLHVYQKLIQPFMALDKSVKNFFVHLNWGSSCGLMEGRVWKCGTWSIPYPDGRAEEERKLESMVMGSGYDAWERGKQVRIDLDGLSW